MSNHSSKANNERFRNTCTYSKAALSGQSSLDTLVKKSDISENSGLNITKPMDDSGSHFVELAQYSKMDFITKNSKSAKKSLKSSTLGRNHIPFILTDFNTPEERNTYYDDDPLELQDKGLTGQTINDKIDSSKEIGIECREMTIKAKHDTISVMQDNYHKNGPTNESKFLQVLSNTRAVYEYALFEEYLLEILKNNDLGEYMDDYVQLLDSNDIDYHKCIIDLGQSSLQRFLINHEKRVFEFPPQETDNLMVVRNGECSSDLKLNRKQKKRIANNVHYNEKHQDVIYEAVEKCNEVLGPIRRRMSKWDYIIFAYIIIGLLVSGGLGFILLYYLHYILSIVVGIVFICGIIFLLWYSKKNAHEVLLSSHICMAFIASYFNLKYTDRSLTFQPCLAKRASHNISAEYQSEIDCDRSKVPLQNSQASVKIKFMPGYLGKWLEIHIVLSQDERKLYADQSLGGN